MSEQNVLAEAGDENSFLAAPSKSFYFPVASSGGLVTESDLQHRGQHPPPFPVLTASGLGTTPASTSANTTHGPAPLPDSASGSTRTAVSSGTFKRVKELFQPVLNLIPIHTLE